jgi:hypothetical protein
MKIKMSYPISVDRWIHLPPEKFFGLNRDNQYTLIFGITPEDPLDLTCCYFNVWVEKEVKNETTGEIAFYAKTYSVFKVNNEFKIPTADFFFSLVCQATRDFAELFYTRTNGTNLEGHKIKKPQFSEYQEDLQKTIDIWSKKYRNSHLQTRPDWQRDFRDLPTIPSQKQWLSNSHSTVEQDISRKLLEGKHLTSEELTSFKELTVFYDELYEKLKKLDYKTFTITDSKNFENYINYAFNYAALLSNQLDVVQTYRLVVNEGVLKEDRTIENANLLKYPSLDIVKQINRYNRANTPRTNLFYSTETIDAALKELRPPKNKLVTVGVWKRKDPKRGLVSFPISHSDVAIEKSYSVRNANQAFESDKSFGSDLLKQFARNYFKVLGAEFTKRVENHQEYMISALFSETILSLREDELNPDFKYDCIIYPSVGNDFDTHNLAILPKVIDEDFQLVRVMEFRVVEPYYERRHQAVNPDTISLAKIEALRFCRGIAADGTINW